MAKSPVKRNNRIPKYENRRNFNDSYKYRRPFWLPASNFYILAVAVALVFFFIVWGLFHDEEMPYIPAGIGASLILVGAVILREIVLRKMRNRFLLAQKRLDYNLNNAVLRQPQKPNPNKLTIEKNAAIIAAIRKKSEAAQVLGKLPDGHREVFQMCNEYLLLNEKELETVGTGSPRLAALRRGKEIIGGIHRFHLLAWTEIESRRLTQESKNCVTISEKLKTAQEALSVLGSALQFYPDENRLLESEEALKNFIASIKISHRLEQAERAAFKGNYKRAISHYRDALFFLARENVKEEEKEKVAEQINTEIEKLRHLSAENEKNKTKLRGES